MINKNLNYEGDFIMENINLEQIDLIMQRANVSYSEAKAALEQANGDILEALLLLEQNNKIKTEPTHKQSDTKQKVTSFIDKLNATNFIMKKGSRTYVDVPLSVALIGILLSLPWSILTLVFSIIFGIKIKISGENEIAEKINSTIDNLSK